MFEEISCAKGHRWQPTLAPNVWPPDFRSACPSCGAPPVSLLDAWKPVLPIFLSAALVLLAVGAPLLVLGLLVHGPLWAAVGFVLAALGGAALAAAGMTWRATQRIKRMTALAGQMGLDFVQYVSVGNVRQAAPFPLFSRGDAQAAGDVMQGRVGDCPAFYMDFSYTVRGSTRPGGERSEDRSYGHSVVILFDGAKGLPDFRLTPRTFLERVVGRNDPAEIQPEDADEFAKHYHLTGPDEGAVRKTFRPAVVAYFDRERRWSVESLNGQLMVYHSPALGPERVPGLVTAALEVRDLLRGAERAGAKAEAGPTTF